MFDRHAVLADTAHVWSLWVMVVVGLFVLGYFVFNMAAFVSILRSGMDGGMKLVWLVLAFVAPFLGSLLWFVIGKRREETVARVESHLGLRR